MAESGFEFEDEFPFKLERILMTRFLKTDAKLNYFTEPKPNHYIYMCISPHT